jgi:uncharacterized membrane protein (DUF441 family)
MSLRNAFSELVTEPIALRLNQIVATLSHFGLALDRVSNVFRTSVVSGTVTTVTTVATLTNQSSIGGASAQTLVADSMATRWATCVRGRIT